MSRSSIFAKLLRWVGIILMGLTALFTIMGGAGTTCVAVNAAKYGERMAPLAEYQWLYVFYVLATVAIGILGVRATVLLIKGTANAYRTAMIVLIAGVLVGVLHIFTSRAIRGGSMPVDMVVFVTVFTLFVFLLFRIPFVWQGVNFEKPQGAKNDNGPAAAITLFSGALMTFAIQYAVGSTHTWGGVNYADAFHASMTILGLLLLLAGLIVTAHEVKEYQRLSGALTVID